MASDETFVLKEFLTYDEDLPLQVIESQDASQLDGSSNNHVQYHVTFTSVHDQRVPALLTLPSEPEPPYPAVLILHGVLGHKSSFNQVKRAAFLADAGYATLRIDAQYGGERPSLLGADIMLQRRYCYRNRDAIIQTAVDLMRGIDYLISRDDIDSERIGFAGFSMGGAVGTPFCAHDTRVKAVVLAITGGDFGKLGIPAEDERIRERFRHAYNLVDPVLSVPKIHPRPLLMINATNDEIVPRAATNALFEAAKEPKKIIWYDCGHAELPDEYLMEMETFFDTEL